MRKLALKNASVHVDKLALPMFLSMQKIPFINSLLRDLLANPMCSTIDPIPFIPILLALSSSIDPIISPVPIPHKIIPIPIDIQSPSRFP